MSYIYRAFGFMLKLIYDFVDNYGIAIILFTILIKIILLPLTLKQQKSMTKTQQLQPKIKEIAEKYKFDQEKQSQETMKLYKEYGVNPMGGCLPLLIQFPILIAFYRVIQQPVRYLLGKSPEAITKLFKAHGIKEKMAGAQIELAEAMGEINFDFFGLDLSRTPWNEIKGFFANDVAITVALVALIIPALSCITTLLTTKISTMMNGNKKEEKEEKKPGRVLSPEPKKSSSGGTESMTKSMNMIMPLMTLWLTLTFPAAMGLYWTVSNVASLLQNILLNKYYNKKLTAELTEKDAEIQRIKEEKQKKYNTKRKKRG